MQAAVMRVKRAPEMARHAVQTRARAIGLENATIARVQARCPGKGNRHSEDRADPMNRMSHSIGKRRDMGMIFIDMIEGHTRLMDIEMLLGLPMLCGTVTAGSKALTKIVGPVLAILSGVARRAPTGPTGVVFL